MPDGGLTGFAKDVLAKLASSIVDGRVRTRLGGISQCDSPRQIQLFSTISSDGLPANFVEMTTPINASEQIPCFYSSKVERLWRVRTSGVELQRFSAGAVVALTRPQILGPATPAAMSRGGSVTYKFRVRVCSLSGNYDFLMDAGQPIEVYGNQIQVTVVGPANALEVTDVNAAVNTQQGLLLDSIVGVSILAAEQSLSQKQVRFTQHIHVAAGGQTSIPVPDHAIGVKVYTGSGPAPALWTKHIGDPAILATALATGTILFRADTSENVSNLMGDATHIRTDINVGNARFFTIVWTIRP